MVISPWHSIEVKPGTKNVAVHHHNTACKSGKSVGKNHRRPGTDNRPLCKACARLDAEGR